MESFPIWCDGCNQQGKIFVNNPDKPVFVICKNCGYETSQVWCPKCEIGGEFIEKISERPKEWSCPNCNSQYMLPSDFYIKPVELSAQRKSWKKNTKEYDPSNLIRLTLIGIIIGLFLLTTVKSVFGAVTIWVGIVVFVAFMLYINKIKK
jgi:hypothetical protein